MRLKLFFTPQLCLSLAILAQPRLFIGSHKLFSHIHPVNQNKGAAKKRRRNGYCAAATSSLPSWRKLLVLHTVFLLAVAFAAQRGVHNLKVGNGVYVY